MIIICIATGLLVGIVAIGLAVASIYVAELRDWPVGKVSVSAIAALWLWCVVIFPVYYWFRYLR